ncbi:phosphoadenylyl-sulfate reductase [Rhodanobacter denitrificans]|uniref:Phosphoadenosine 5'-phosphosulfate reductase n=1 Tax=Rhodanobacter denitrificans TaxID=666685 RepID=A0A368KDW0_9GAMM|nr:phosphoadenylyl-sulfate reductase [Rhodanobacter denitrificans]RCS30099.1 phosphoadenylyl-sulfate reductase [Rhodanobacter denitrificans]
MSAVLLEQAPHEPRALAALNAMLSRLDAERRVAWALENVAGEHVLSSSFGAQSAVSLHLVTRQRPSLPVVLIDTGYLFAETYRFVDELSGRLGLNLKVYSSPLSPAWMEARHGRLWEQGVAGLDHYNRLRKVEPMQRALADLHAAGWFAGLRRGQSRSRAAIEFAAIRNGRWKFHPLADWSDRDIGQYLARHGLPYHPLWQQGYISIGDSHTSHRWEPGMDAEDTRFFGLKRECGLHSMA